MIVQLGSLWFFRGSGPVLLRNTLFFFLFFGPPAPLWIRVWWMLRIKQWTSSPTGMCTFTFKDWLYAYAICILLRLIWVCTLCICPTKNTLGVYGLTVIKGQIQFSTLYNTFDNVYMYPQQAHNLKTTLYQNRYDVISTSWICWAQTESKMLTAKASVFSPCSIDGGYSSKVARKVKDQTNILITIFPRNVCYCCNWQMERSKCRISNKGVFNHIFRC